MTAVLAPLLAKLFAVLATGALLRKRLPPATTRVLNRAIIDVLMPALLLLVLARIRFDPSVTVAALPFSVAQLVVGAAALLVARAFALPRPAQGSAAMTTAFANTGFLGYPVVLALFGADATSSGTASGTAIAIDTVCTTAWMWSFGVVLAARCGGGRPFSLRGLVRALVRPLTLAVALGLALSWFGVSLPASVDMIVSGLGVLVSVLVFFSLGLSLGVSLDTGALKGRLPPVAAMSALKLLLMPALVLVLARALGLPEVVTVVAVLQGGMPSAMVSVIISADEGCDHAFAAGVAALSTVLCVATLPAVAWLVEATR